MKKILIYALEFYPYENANTNVLMPILEELKKKYDISVFTVDYNKNLPAYEEYKGIKIIRYRRTFAEIFFAELLAAYDMSRAQIVLPPRRIKCAIWSVMHATLSRANWHKLLVSPAISKRYLRQMQTEKYAAVISFSAPITAHYDTLNVQKKWPVDTKWLPFFSDPHATFIGCKALYKDLMQQEMKIYQCATAVFTTKEIYEDNLSHPLKKFRDKTIPVSYVNFRPLYETVKIPYINKNRIVCAYTGSLFSYQIRNPEYFYQLARACGNDFEFHIICYRADDYNIRLKEKYVIGSNEIIWHNRTSLQECTSLLCNADILINLGNLSTNQTPSKIFDYISAGKPIVNIHPLKNDTANPYLLRYPLFLSILEKQTLDINDVEQFKMFCKENKGKSIPFDTIKNLYSDMSVAMVAQQFAEQIEL